MSENKQYENAYKVQAVKLAKNRAANAAKELQIPVNTLDCKNAGKISFYCSSSSQHRSEKCSTLLMRLRALTAAIASQPTPFFITVAELTEIFSENHKNRSFIFL